VLPPWFLQLPAPGWSVPLPAALPHGSPCRLVPPHFGAGPWATASPPRFHGLEGLSALDGWLWYFRPYGTYYRDRLRA